MSKREEMESVIRRYFEGCNEGSVDKLRLLSARRGSGLLSTGHVRRCNSPEAERSGRDGRLL